MRFPLDQAKNNGITALGIACLKGYYDIVETLVEAGAEVNQTAPNGIGPLYLAIKGNHLDVVKYLMSKNAQLHFVDPVKADFSPIFYAIKTG